MPTKDQQGVSIAAFSILHLILGALIGAVTGWALYAGFYLEFKELGGTFGIRALREPVPKSFWRVSLYAALIGSLIGIAVVAWNRI